jgi:tRNA G18 (ribose-2'-O)-methylase SpoU
VYRARNIESFDLPQLQPYRTMRRQVEHRLENIFVAEGEKVVRRLLESDLEVVSVLLPEKWFEDLKSVLQSRREQIEVFVAPKQLLETLTGFSMYQGLLAVGRVPAQPSLQHLLERSQRPWLFAAVDGLSSAQNIGALVRNCAAFGVHGVVTSGNSSSPFLRRAIRASMGTIFQQPVLETGSLLDIVGQLKASGIHCVAAHPHTGGTLFEADLVRDCCIIFGSEGYGISTEVLAVCDEAAAIPMSGTVDSLNVASAAAAFLCETLRQRANKGGISGTSSAFGALP